MGLQNSRETADRSARIEDSPSREGYAVSIDPFLLTYETGEWKADSETINTLLTGIIAVANISSAVNHD